MTSPIERTQRGEQVRYARTGSTYFSVLLASFCVVLVVSNIVATKGIEFGTGDITLGPIQVWPIIADGGALLFPLAYVFGDVISEVYGFRAARTAVYTSFALATITSLTFLAVQYLPGASFYEHQGAYEAVLGFVPRIVAASLAGYVVGQLLNALVLTKMKSRTAERKLWQRVLGSTGVGELADTIIFCTIAATVIGIDTFGQYVNYVVIGYVYKVTIEVILLPITLRIIAWLKTKEPTYYAEA